MFFNAYSEVMIPRRRHCSTWRTTGATRINTENTASRRCSATSTQCTWEVHEMPRSSWSQQTSATASSRRAIWTGPPELVTLLTLIQHIPAYKSEIKNKHAFTIIYISTINILQCLYAKHLLTLLTQALVSSHGGLVLCTGVCVFGDAFQIYDTMCIENLYHQAFNTQHKWLLLKSPPSQDRVQSHSLYI